MHMYIFQQIFLKWRSVCRSFQTLDSTGSGKLSHDEFAAVLKLSGILLSEQDLSLIFAEFKDEGSDAVCYREFLNTIRDT